MAGVDVRPHGRTALTEPRDHRDRRLTREAAALEPGADDPRDLGRAAERLDRRLHVAGRSAALPPANDPIEPAAAPVGRPAARLPLESLDELHRRRRLAAGEEVERRV